MDEVQTGEKVGEWENVHFSYGIYSGRCSNCKLYSGPWLLNQWYKFCPFCGYRMKWREKDGNV